MTRTPAVSRTVIEGWIYLLPYMDKKEEAIYTVSLGEPFWKTGHFLVKWLQNSALIATYIQYRVCKFKKFPPRNLFFVNTVEKTQILE